MKPESFDILEDQKKLLSLPPMERVMEIFSRIGETPKEKVLEIPKEKLIEIYEKMVLIRQFEIKCHELFDAGKFPGFMSLVVGKEAIYAGACANLRKEDYASGTHSSHGQYLAKGCDPKSGMAELYGKKTGCAGGRGGTFHLRGLDMGFLGATGIVGSFVAVATGAALSAKLRGTDQVAVAFVGDAGFNRGPVYESLNLASYFKLPAIYIIERDKFLTAPYLHKENVEDLALRGFGFGIPSYTVNGNDVIAVYEIVKEAVKRARAGEGPTLVECKTNKYYDQSEGHHVTAGFYGDIEPEREEWKKRDSIATFRAKLTEMKIFTKEELDGIDQKTAKIIEDCVEFAEKSPFPAPDDALKGVYY